jgi:hypothetical protein
MRLFLLFVIVGICLSNISCGTPLTNEEISRYKIDGNLNKEQLIERFKNKFENTCIMNVLGDCAKKIGTVSEKGFVFFYTPAGKYYQTSILVNFNKSPYLVQDSIMVGHKAFMAFDNREDLIIAYNLLHAIFIQKYYR